jgi:hypothetical protein
MIGNPQAARTAIYDALAANADFRALVGGASLRLYQQIGKQGAAFPMGIIRSLPPQRDTQNASAQTIFSNLIFDVFGTDEGLDFRKVELIQAQIDISITGLRVAVGSNRVLTARRVNPISDSKTVNGISYVEAGVRYDLSIK